MTINKKFRLMQQIWNQRNRDPEEPNPPAWHSEVLVNREVALECGDEGFEDWDEARMTIEFEIKRHD